MDKQTNICYKTGGILQYFLSYRDKWEDFYTSEKWAFETLARDLNCLGNVLDVGCALGGLGLALSSRFHVLKYTGIDINYQAIERAREQSSRFRIPVQFECGDIVRMKWSSDQLFDVVVSLSCADWNIETNKIVQACWERVRPGGHFVMSVRLTPEMGINDIKKSYQEIYCGSGTESSEIANYVVFGRKDFSRLIKGLTPVVSEVSAYGYWGEPSGTAHTPYKRLVFAVFLMRKNIGGSDGKGFKAELKLPFELFE